MRVTKAEVRNFGSYKYLGFDFQNCDLTLIQGPTGSGKSTLCDIVPWCLFGATAKNGSVNDVIAWNAEGATEGTIEVDLSNRKVRVHRTRNPNDLYFYLYEDLKDSYPQRGKDLIDTQRIINEIIGIDLELYLTGAYFHEFSHLAGFFVAPARARRELCEQLVDLTFAENLQSKLSSSKQEIKPKIASKDKDLQVLKGKIEIYEKDYHQNHEKALSWKLSKIEKIRTLSLKRNSFEKEKEETLKSLTKRYNDFETSRQADIEQIANRNPTVCQQCGNPKPFNEKFEAETTQKLKKLNLEVNPFASIIEKVAIQGNDYTEQIQVLQAEENPYTGKGDLKRLNEAKLQQSNLEKDLEALQQSFNDSQELQDLIAVFRSSLVQRTIFEVEVGTNDLISKYFDAEIRVQFSLTADDKLEVIIWKNGNECNYAQLSKGQRQILKLSFGLSVMQIVSRHHGIRFNAIFLDEALDGLDDSFKTKAYNLLASLRLKYESIFVVEHSEALKTLFESKITVELMNGHSVISE